MTVLNDISEFKPTQMMITNDFEIYHYRQPYFNSLDFHNHDFLEIYIFLDGNVTYYIEEKAYDLCAEDIIVIPPGKMHRPVISDAEAVYERIVLWVDLNYLNSIDDCNNSLINIINRIEQDKSYLVNITHSDFKFLTKVIEKLKKLSQDNESNHQLLMKSYVSIAISQLNQVVNSADSLTQQMAASGKLDIIPEIIEYINDNLQEKLTLDDICNNFFISKFHLIRKFKEYTNATLYDYIIAKRIILAKKLIRAGVSATDACQQCGFTDYSNFYKAFILKTGMTPAKFKSYRT